MYEKDDNDSFSSAKAVFTTTNVDLTLKNITIRPLTTSATESTTKSSEITTTETTTTKQEWVSYWKLLFYKKWIFIFSKNKQITFYQPDTNNASTILMRKNFGELELNQTVQLLNEGVEPAKYDNSSNKVNTHG